MERITFPGAQGHPLAARLVLRQLRTVAQQPVQNCLFPLIQRLVQVGEMEVLGIHRNGLAGGLGETAFDFHDAVDGGRVRIGSRDQECFVFDRPKPYERFAVQGSRSYYNVKCHDEETFAF